MDRQEEEDAFVTFIVVYMFGELQLGQSIAGAIRTTSLEGKYGGRLSEIRNLTFPGCLVSFAYVFYLILCI